MLDALTKAGIRNYSIFRHGLTLFGYFETDDLDRTIGDPERRSGQRALGKVDGADHEDRDRRAAQLSVPAAAAMAHGLTMRLEGEIAFVTGAGRGIGAETARVLARHGAAVVVTARKRVYAERSPPSSSPRGGRALALSCDVTDAGSIEAAVAVATQQDSARRRSSSTMPASSSPLGALHETEPAEWAANVTANLVGAAQCSACGAACHACGRARHDRQPLLRCGASSDRRLERILRGESRPGHADARRLPPNTARRASGSSASRRAWSIRTCRRTIRASGIGPVAKVPREKLASPREPAEAIAFLASQAGDRFAGQELDIRNADFRAAAGLAPIAA